MGKAGAGLPVPRRRTFAEGILPSAHSDADYAPQSLLRLSAYAGSQGMGSPAPPDLLRFLQRWSLTAARVASLPVAAHAGIQIACWKLRSQVSCRLAKCRVRCCVRRIASARSMRPASRSATSA